MSNLLELYRQQDEKTPQGEVLPQNETLNGERIGKYLRENGFNSVQNFDQRFAMQNVYDVLAQGNTKGEQEMLTMIQSAQNFLESIGREKLMLESPTRESFASTINKELLRRNQLDQEANLLKAYDTFKTVKDIMRSRLVVHESFAEQRKDETAEIGKGIKETFSDVYKDVKKNFKGMSGGEKLMAVGALVVGGIWFSTSTNESVKAVREKLWTGVKLAGGAAVGAVGFNYLWKMFTGKTALTYFEDAVSSSTGTSEFWEKSFETDAAKAEILRKGMIYLGDRDFLDMAKKYKEAKAKGETKIELVTVDKKDMTPEEIFTALDVFFGKYPVEKLELRYRKAGSNPNFLDVATTMLAEDGRIEFSGNLYDRAVSTIDDLRIRGWNWMATGAGLESGRWLYLKVRGTEGTDEEVKTWMEKELKPHLDNAVGTDGELVDFTERKFRDLPGFRQCVTGGMTETAHPNVRYFEVPGDAIYVMSTVSMNVARGNDQMVSHMLDNSLEQSDKFLKARYPQAGDSLAKFRDVKGGTRVEDNNTFKLFVRMPVPGSAEYSRRSVLTTPDAAKERNVDLFKPTDVISYTEMLQFRSWEAEQLRLHFMMDGSRTADLEKICKRFTDEYKNKSLSKKEVMKKLFEDTAERDKCLAELGITPNLAGKYNLMKIKDEELNEIERDAAKKVDSSVLKSIGRLLLPDSWVDDVNDAYDHLVVEMKRKMGFKVRLAILGDPTAMAEFVKLHPEKLNPAKNANWMDDLIDIYKESCKRFVDKYKAGNV